MGKEYLILGIVLMVPTLLLAIMLIKRTVYREFPCFFAYVVSSFLISVVRLSTIRSYSLYYTLYWATDVIYVITKLLALHESFKWEFLDFYEHRPFRFVFPAVVAAILVPAISFSLKHAFSGPPLFAAIFAVVTAVNYVTIGLVFLFLICVVFFGFEWHRYPFGIVIGFTVASLQYWVVYGMHLEFGANVKSFMQHADPATQFLASVVIKYAVPITQLCGTAVWLGVFAKEMVLTPPDELSSCKAVERLDDAERNIQSLKDLGKTKYGL
jgi:hypothetical protein